MEQKHLSLKAYERILNLPEENEISNHNIRLIILCNSHVLLQIIKTFVKPVVGAEMRVTILLHNGNDTQELS